MGSLIGRVIPGFGNCARRFILFSATIIANLILTRTVLGRYTVALGSNEEAARLSGVSAWMLEDRGLCAGRRVQRAGRRAHGPLA